MRRTINFLFNLGEDQPDRKFSVGILLDLSGSMHGTPLEQVKVAINSILRPLSSNQWGDISFINEISIHSFHTNVQQVCPWVEEKDFDFFKDLLFGIPSVNEILFSNESGATALYDGIGEVLDFFSTADSNTEHILLLFSDGCENKSKKFDKAAIKNLIKINQGTLNPIKICSLYYRSDNASPRGNKLLDELAELTKGVVYESPNADSISQVLMSLFHHLLYGEKSGIRAGLIARLRNSENMDEKDWFRIYSINSPPERSSYEQIINQDEHTIFNIHYDNEAYSSRNFLLDRFKVSFAQKNDNHNIVSVLSNNLNRQNQFLKSFQSNPIVYLVFRGTDITGPALSLYISSLLDEIRKNPQGILGTFDNDFHLFLIVLTDNLISYKEDNYKNLSALFNEINILDKNFTKVHGVFIISDRNDHISENPGGFKTLNNQEFEQLTIEILTNINLHQDLVIKTYLESHKNRKNSPEIYDRFLSIGCVSVFSDQKRYIERITKIISHDLISHLFDDNFQTNAERINLETKQFLTEISFSGTKNRLINTNQDNNLISKIDCPSITDNTFGRYHQEIQVKLVNHMPGGDPYQTYTLFYFDHINYLEFLLFDVRNYVESCHAIAFFENEIEKRAGEFLCEKYTNLKRVTDRMLYQDDTSSPKQAVQWIDQLFASLTDYIEKTYERESHSDPEYLSLCNYVPETSSNLLLLESDPEEYLNKLREKLENFPLPITIRSKYYSLATLFASGLIPLFPSLNLPMLSIVSLIFPLGIVMWGEYKIYQLHRQVKELIRLYGLTHRNKARKIAFEFLIIKINELLIELKNKVKTKNGDIPSEFSPREYMAEEHYLELFRRSLTTSFVKSANYTNTANSGIAKFHIDVSDGFYDRSDQLIQVIDRNSLPNLAGISSVDWAELFKQISGIKSNFLYYYFPTIKTDFIPPILLKNFFEKSYGQINPLLNKLEINEVVKGKTFFITLLEDLNDEEIHELKAFFNHGIWNSAVDRLIELYIRIEEVRNSSIFVLWREVGLYQIWLMRVAEMIKMDRDFSTNLNVSSLFRVWKRMYLPQRQFREGLINSLKIVLNIKDSALLDIWKVINTSKNKDRLIDYLKTYSFAPIYLTNPTNTYTEATNRLYESGPKNAPSELMRIYNLDLKTLLNDTHDWDYFEGFSDYSLTFAKNVTIPFNNSAFLRTIKESFNDIDFANDNGEWKKFFLEEFRKTFLSTKKQRKEVKWLFK